MLPKLDQSLETNRRYFWLERGIAIVAALNLALVVFDLTYLNARSLYLQTIPSVVQAYDPVKGIRPQPETQRYLERAAALESQLAQIEVNSSEVEASLAELRSYSQRLIQDNPFPINGNATLETIQQSLQSRTGAESSFVAFDRFWNQDYLTQASWRSELEFWNQQIRPLMDAAYYRQVDRFGHPIDYFWLFDLPFMLVFVIDFAIRNRAIRRRHPELSWLKSALRRGYDLFLFVPIGRWLRVIPVTLRLHQVGLLNLEPLQAEARRDFAIGFAKQLVEVAGIQAIDQLQSAIRRGDVMRRLLNSELHRDYVQVNDRNEISAIVAHIADLSIHTVLPQMQPDVEIFIYHVLRHFMVEQIPGYRQLKLVPVIGNLPGQTTEKITMTLSKSIYQSLEQFLQNPEVAKLTTQLLRNFWNALSIELQKKRNTQEIEELLIDMLEEIKINYVQNITEAGIEQIIEEAEQLQRKVKS